MRPSLPERLRCRLAALDWTPDRVERLLRGMPKVETHLHLDGALSPGTIKTLAVRQGYAPLKDKSVEEIARLAVVDKPMGSLAEVLEAFTTIYPLLRRAEALEQAAYDLVAAAAPQNIRHVEVRFCPALHAAPGFDSEAALGAALRGLERGRAAFGVGWGVIVCFIRPFSLVSAARNREMAELALAYKDRGVVAVDLAGDEAAQPLSDYAELFERALSGGLGATAHAGEAPGSADIETALGLGVHRLGHATRVGERPGLLERAAARGIPIEVNLTSNLRTGTVPDYAAHPLRDWLRAGVPVLISTDDPGVFGIDLVHEYRVLRERLGFMPEELAQLALDGVEGLFLSEREKGALRVRFEADLEGVLGLVV